MLSHGGCGLHHFSPTGAAGTWDAAKLPGGGCAFPRVNVSFADGGRIRSFWRRERPHLVMAADGRTLAALTTGTMDSPTNPYVGAGSDSSYTMLQRIRAKQDAQ